MNDIKLSLCQIEKMQHAIGFDRRNIKNMRYKAYRNRYIVSHLDNDWEELVSIGYAIRKDFEIDKLIVYCVSEFGIQYLCALFGCNISDVD